METYTVQAPRWPILRHLLGRGPLTRTTDRVEAIASVLTILVTLLFAPLAAAIGTEVYDVRSNAYSEQAATRHSVAATVTGVPEQPEKLGVATITVQARWTFAGVEHMGAVATSSTVKIGDSVDMWVSEDGSQVPAPTPTTRAAVEAITVALVIWTTFAAAAASLFTLTRTVCDRVRYTRWQQAIDSLLQPLPNPTVVESEQRATARLSRPGKGLCGQSSHH
jgi:hypothetical protein